MAKKTPREIMFKDENTGELHEALIVPLLKGTRIKGWFMTMQKGLNDLAKAKLFCTKANVFLYMLSRMDYENWVPIEQKEICEELGYHHPNVSRALSALCEEEIFVREKLNDGILVYRLHSRIGWKGKTRRLLEHERQALEKLAKVQKLKRLRRKAA